MRIVIVTPAPPGSRKGNRVTAERWRGFLLELGHEVEVLEHWDGQPAELMLALHAGRSADSIARWARRGPLILALTGTDVYGEITTDPLMVASVAAADRLLVLQPLAINRLLPADRAKARVVYQSCRAPQVERAAGARFEVCVLAHLREVKRPLLAGRAAALLPASSRVRITHLGKSLDPELEAEIRSLQGSRYEWLGELPRARALDVLARSHLLVVSSRTEGGANVVTEAIACGTPVVSTRIDGSVGLLGEDYSGYIPVDDAPALAQMLEGLANDRELYRRLERELRELAPLACPDGERARLRGLLSELV